MDRWVSEDYGSAERFKGATRADGPAGASVAEPGEVMGLPDDAAYLPDVAGTEQALARLRPELLGAYRAAVPGARAAVLGRLWVALCREPIPGVVGRMRRGEEYVVGLADGREVTGPAWAAAPFAVCAPGLVLRVAGRAYDDPAALAAAVLSPGGGGGSLVARFAAELANSVANVALARAVRAAAGTGRPDQGAGAGSGAGVVSAVAGPGRRVSRAAVDELVEWESAVVDGHPLHPACRTRAGMSTSEVLAYAPEHRPTVPLRLVAVPPERWLTTGAGLPPLLPVHPWQHDHVLGAYRWLRDTGGRVAARPLMSLRTVVPVRRPWFHVKTAVDVRMTSAVRTVSAAAVRNGPPVTAFLAELAARVAAGWGGELTVLRETAAGAVLVDGEPCRSLAVVVRQAPTARPGEVVLPLAALAVGAPADGVPPAVAAVAAGYRGDPGAFLADLAGLLLRATLALLRLGVALEAHGQNTLVALRGGRPVRLLYRDVGGIRVSPRRLRGHGLTPPSLYGDLVEDDPRQLRDTLFAALGTVLGEQVAVLGRACGVVEGELWRAVATAARRVVAELPSDAAADVAALWDATWPVKATTAMRLAADPLEVIWARQPNPLMEQV